MSYNSHDRAMDRYITGNWGEDQFRGECECELPYEGKQGDKWTCDRCGTIYELDHFEEDGPYWESVGQVELADARDWPEPDESAR